MNELQIYTRKFHLSEIMDLACLSPFEISVHELHMHHLEQIELGKPSLYLIRLEKAAGMGEAYQEWVNENFEYLWHFVGMLRARNKNAAVLLLIPDKNFELVYRALSCHVDEVIVEPAAPEELNEKIENCIAKIQRTAKRMEDQRRLEEYEFNKRQKIMERILENLLDKPEDVDFLIPEINKRYGTKLGTRHYQAIVIGVDQFELYNKDSRFVREISLIAIHQFSGIQEIILGEIDPYGLIAILNLPDHYEEYRKKEELAELRGLIMQLQETYGTFKVTIGVGRMVERMKDIHTSLNEAAYVQEYRMLKPGEVLYAQDYPDMMERLDSYLSDRSIRELCRYVALGDAEHIREWFGYFYREIEPQFRQFPPAYASFCWKMYQSVKEMEKSSKIQVFPDVKFFSLQHIFEGDARMRECEILLMEISHMMQSEVSSEHEIAFHAIAYMKVHYSEPITLETIAENSGLSTSYFSRKFKEQTGENYIDVLTDIRMKEAERMLLETDDRIEAIIEKTGYCDDKHFRKLFLRHTGMNPSEYRKKGRKA